MKRSKVSIRKRGRRQALLPHSVKIMVQPSTSAGHTTTTSQPGMERVEYRVHSFDLVEVERFEHSLWLGMVMDPEVHGCLGALPPRLPRVDVMYPGYRKGERLLVSQLKPLGTSGKNLWGGGPMYKYLNGVSFFVKEVCHRLNVHLPLASDAPNWMVYHTLCQLLKTVDPQRLRLSPEKAGHLVHLHPKLEEELNSVLLTWRRSMEEDERLQLELQPQQQKRRGRPPKRPEVQQELPQFDKFYPMDLCMAKWGLSTRKEYYPVMVLHPKMHGSVEERFPGLDKRDVHFLGYEQSASRVPITDLMTLHEGVPLLLQPNSAPKERQLLQGIHMMLEEVKHRVGGELGAELPADADLHSLVDNLRLVLDTVQPAEDMELRISGAGNLLGSRLQRSLQKVVDRLDRDRTARNAPPFKFLKPSEQAYRVKLAQMLNRRASNAADPVLRDLRNRFIHNLKTGQPDPNLRICTSCFADLSVRCDADLIPVAQVMYFDNPYMQGFHYCEECQRKCRICGEDDTNIILMCKSMCSSHICYGAWCEHCLESWGGPGLYEELRQEREADPDWHCPLCHPRRTQYGLFTRHEDWKINLFFLYEFNKNLRTLYDPRRLAGLYERDVPKKVCSLFNGSGAIFELLRELGYQLDEKKCVSYEINFKANMLSRAHNPEIPQRGDAAGLTMEEICHLGKKFDLIVGGPPCQEFTLANPRAHGPFDPDKSGALTLDFAQYLQLTASIKLGPTGFLMENVRMSREHRGIVERAFHLRSIELEASKHGEVSRRRRMFISNAPYFYVPYFQRTRVLDDILSNGRRACQQNGKSIQHLRTLTSKLESRMALRGGSDLLVVDADGKADRVTVTEYEDSLGYPIDYTGITLPDGTTLTHEDRMYILSQGWPLTVVREILARFQGPPTEVPGYKLYTTCPLLQEQAPLVPVTEMAAEQSLPHPEEQPRSPAPSESVQSPQPSTSAERTPELLE